MFMVDLIAKQFLLIVLTGSMEITVPIYVSLSVQKIKTILETQAQSCVLIDVPHSWNLSLI